MDCYPQGYFQAKVIAMSFFTDAVQQVLKSEGGFVNDPNDAGGPTNFGITLADLRIYKKDPSVGIEAIQGLSVAEAQEIYRTLYWEPLGLEACTNRLAAVAILDQAVNRGMSNVVREAQAALGVIVDGVVGEKTLAALNAVDPVKFIVRFVVLAQAKYIRIVTHDKTQLEFLGGWLARTQDLLLLLVSAQ